MFAIIISFLFSSFQTYLLKILMSAITSGNKKKALKFFFLKFFLYGVAIALVMYIFMKYVSLCLIGFIIGMPITAIWLFIYYSFIKKI